MTKSFRLWASLQPFKKEFITTVPDPLQGVYVIYVANRPFYVGRSMNGVRGRLLCHFRGAGNSKVRLSLGQGERLDFTFAEIMSFQQFEALLIRELGTAHGEIGNLRNESDPADRF